MRFLQKHQPASWQAFSPFSGKYLISRVASLFPFDTWPNWGSKAGLQGWKMVENNGTKLHLIHSFTFLTNPQCYHYAYRLSNKFSKELAKVSSPTNRLWDLDERNTLEGMKEKKCASLKQKPRTPAQSNLSNTSLTKIHKPRIFHNKPFTL